jgi:ubiquinone/menaquinone biosynthesis C-methylase UbiE
MVSRRANKQLIEAGQVEIRHGSVSSLPFSDSEFDYYWPDLVADMKEVLRVLKPGGTLMILGGAYKGGRQRARNQRFAQLINAACQSRDELGDSSLRPAIQMFRSSRTIAGVGSVA